ncbi:MAG: Ig-like domain-containing protein [Bacteroidales bacterium]|nr:Ig-like domain-containing protein [Bacteroidales bacterium]
MKTKLTQLFALFILIAGMAVNAQVPAKLGSWTFDNAADLVAAETGAPLELIGTAVTSVPGPVAGNLAVEVGNAASLKLTHGIAAGNGGGTMVNEYTLMMDVQLPTPGLWHPFFQTDLANASDADLWSRNNNSFLGTGALGYGTKAVLYGVWYRTVISVKNGTSFQVFMNGELYLQGNVQALDGRYALAEAVLLFTDDTPSNDNPMICSELAVWDVALTEAQIIELGSAPIVATTGITVSGEGDVSVIDTDKGTLQMMIATLPVDATYQTAFWSVADGTGSATINFTGLLTATMDGTVTVTATAKDDPGITATKEITISNQVLEVDPVGSWKFDDAGDMLKAEIGLPLELTGTQTSVPGPQSGNLATEVGTGSFLKLTHGIAAGNGGGTMVNEYTIVMDVQLPTLGIWHPFFQTDPLNASDADLWARGVESTLGTGDLGYGSKALMEGVWYRMVISVKNGTFFKVFLNTELYLEGNVQALDGRYALANALLLFADNTPSDDNPVICSDLAIYDVALSVPQIMALGSVPVTLATGVTVTGAGDATVIDTDNGTLQMMAAVVPADATYQETSWSLMKGTGNATISSTGLLSAIEDGTVTVIATSKDAGGASGSLEITISNQVLTMSDFNLIKDGTFETDGAIASPWGFWSGNGGAASVAAGVCEMIPGGAAENWQLQVSQVGNTAGWRVYNDSSYVFMFDAKANAARVFSIDFEDSSNGYARFGVSSAADAANGESQWDVALTTDMTTYTRDVTFNRVKENTNFKLNIMPSAALDPVSIDNIYLIKASDIHKFGTLVSGITVKSAGDATVIDTDMGTLQMMVDVLPVDATLQGVFWTVENGTGKASITSKGLLSAIYDGTVTVKAIAKDGTEVMGSLEITISNQQASIKENANMIKGGHFDTEGTIVPTSTLAPNWGGWSGNGGLADVVDGVCTITPSAAAESWQMQVTQLGNDNDWVLVNDVVYVVMFDAWAESERPISVDFEDKSPSYTRFGTSTDADANNGESDWTFNLSTTKTSFTRVFTCTKAQEGSVYKFLISGGASDKAAYFDDIYLMDMASLGTVPGVIAVTDITVTGEGNATTITTDLGTLQMSAAVLPVDATIMNVVWSVVDGTGTATIDSKGLLSAGTNGTVTVKAISQDWVGVEGMLELTISGQTVGISNKTAESVKVYPNPANDELNVTFTSPRANVAIYNSLGRKIEEVFVDGTQAKFDVSKYARGVYFVKVNNESVVKFIK